jgi:membrane fusion protein (multidrug efflux system)
MMMPPPEVTVVRLTAQPVTLTRELPGRTNPFLVAEVRPQVTGIVKRRLFTEGAIVKAGDVLYELDDAVYRAQYNSAKAALAKAQATAEAARSSARRSAELVKIDAVSAQDNDNAVAAMGQANADVGAAEAAVQSAEVNLGYARITAPISGRIGASSVTPGALVTANQATSLATVQQLDPIYVDVNQSASEWLRLKQDIDAGTVKSEGAGTAAGILLEDGTHYGHDGKLQFADVTVDPTTGSFLLRVVVPNPKNTLMPGMYVRAMLAEGVRDNAVLAPQRGITRDQRGNASAMVVGADGKVEPRVVHVSRTIGDEWLVDDGLKAGDRLIVEGLQKIQPGMPVHAVEAGAAPAVAGNPEAGAAAGGAAGSH